MPSREEGRRLMSLSVELTVEHIEQLKRFAASQSLRPEEYGSLLLERALKQEERQHSRRSRPAPGEFRQPAPLDAFLPDGVDPFESNDKLRSGASVLSFEDVQARMRFAGTPALFRNGDGRD